MIYLFQIRVLIWEKILQSFFSYSYLKFYPLIFKNPLAKLLFGDAAGLVSLMIRSNNVQSPVNLLKLKPVHIGKAAHTVQHSWKAFGNGKPAKFKKASSVATTFLENL